MKCLHPIAVALDGKRQFVPCGKCNYCLEARRAAWSFRLRQELKVSSSAHFLTLTYDNDHIPISETGGLPTLCKRDLQLFTKRLRKLQATYTVERLRYYSVGEYGTDTQRPHYHSIMYNMRSEVAMRLHDVWTGGQFMIGTVTDASIHYVAKYHVNKVGEFNGREPPFCLMSRKPGIGFNYLDTHTKWHREGLRGYTKVNGFTAALPRYYVDKIFKDADGEWMVDPELLRGDHSEVETYFKEIQRLEKLHHSPVEYYGERFRANHDAITHKTKISKL